MDDTSAGAPTEGATGLPRPLGAGAAVDAAGAPQEVYRFRYHGDGTAFFFLLLKNILLTAITLFIYRAWAKTARRRYIWSNIEIHGQRLQYTGTGRELFIGYLKVAAVWLGLVLVPLLAGRISSTAQVAAQGALALAVLPLIPFAMYWSRAYVLSRTSWRGIRCGLVGPATPYAQAFLIGNVLTVLTLGLYGPVVMNRLRTIMTNNSRLGSEPFGYDGRDRDVWLLCMKGLVLSILTLGIYYFWFQAALQRYQFEHTRFGQARGRFDLKGGQLLGLFLLNLFGSTLTLGLAFPWIATYSLRRVLESVSFVGPIDFGRVIQRAAGGSGTADGLADALGVDLGF
jgi:uncharacterized membrane protein YjgN (DUF898 family)